LGEAPGDLRELVLHIRECLRIRVDGNEEPSQIIKRCFLLLLWAEGLPFGLEMDPQSGPSLESDLIFHRG
jgi:hypothetical protein